MARYNLCSAAVVCLLAVAQSAAGVEVFTTGIAVPETISPIPDSFGTLEGFLVPDPGAQQVWQILPGGGGPVAFADANLDTWNMRPAREAVLGGLFLPDSWGLNAGQYLTAGYVLFADEAGGSQGLLHTYDSSGDRTLFAAVGGLMTTPVVVPNGFGTYGGDVAVTDQNGFVLLLDPSGSETVLYDHNVPGIAGTENDFNPFGVSFAPNGFGAGGGLLLASEASDERNPGSVRIFSIAADGTPSQFTSIPLLAEQHGLRQMAFGPADYLSPLVDGVLLYVSVAGSRLGGGTQGDVLALDSSGTVVASLRTVDDLTKFDPRGLHFTADGSLLVSDAADPIIIAQPQDFRVGRYGNIIPEPASVVLLVAATMVGFVGRRRMT